MKRSCSLGRQLLTIWLIGVILHPNKTEALKCHSCEGEACKDDKGVDCASGFCEKKTEGATFKMKCSDNAEEAKCILSTFKGCYTFNDKTKEELKTCMRENALGDNVQQAGVTICTCNSELCNNVDGGSAVNKSAEVREGESGNRKDDQTGNDARQYGWGPGESRTLDCFGCSGVDCRDLGKARKVSCNGFCINRKTRDEGISIFKGCEGDGKEFSNCQEVRKKGYYSRQGQDDDYMRKVKVKESSAPAETANIDCIKCSTNLCNFGKRLVTLSSFKILQGFAFLATFASTQCLH